MRPPSSDPYPLAEWIDRYLQRFLAHGLERFVDQRGGGFHEALGANGVATSEPKRLVVQCRQVYVFSHAARLAGPPECLEAARRGVEFLTEHYWDESAGGWFFSVGPADHAADRTRDLYAHAFALFALAHHHAATGDAGALAAALATQRFIDERFRDPVNGGFHEALDPELQPLPRVRRQNPHMHLLEAALALADSSGHSAATSLAEQLYALMRQRFLDVATGTLREFFTDDWQFHPEEGHVVEPGHHFEWAWILERYADLTDTAEARGLADALREWGWHHGRDAVHGGIFDAVDPRGTPLRDSKRIWPQLEVLKAFAVHHERTLDPNSRERLVAALGYLRERYLRPDGSWIEHLDRSGAPTNQRLPGSTGYHLFLGLTEARRALGR
ncbi:MAG: AGE family epimerase/isomerase [Planctomycetota bacterium]